jgi:hypothetical protein
MVLYIAKPGNQLHLEFECIKPCIVYTDNEAMMKFAYNERAVKGTRHMDMRLWYTRDEIARGKVSVLHMFGNRIPTDQRKLKCR